MQIQKITIIGMGALGTLYGTHLLDEGEEVQYVLDESRFQKYAGTLFYKNQKPYHLPMVNAKQAQPADLLIVAVKYPGLPSALDTMASSVGEGTIIMSVMNGIDSEDILAERFGKEHLIYTVAHKMDAIRFGTKLTFKHEGELCIGAKEECQKQNVRDVQEFLERTHIAYQVDDHILHRLWSKFMVNDGLNQVSMVYDTNYDGLLSKGEPNRTMVAAMREVIAVAQAEGIDLGETDLNEYMDVMEHLDPQGYPSMRQDALAKRPCEVEMFSGIVLKLAAKHHLYVPTNEFLYDRIHEIESTYLS